MDSIQVLSGQSVLLLWGGTQPSERMVDFCNTLNEKVGKSGHVQVEHIDRLSLSSHRESQFDVAVSGFIYSKPVNHSIDTLAEVCRILKPGGYLYLQEAVTVSPNNSQYKTASKLVSTLKLSGFVDIVEPVPVQLSDDEKSELKNGSDASDGITLVQAQAQKPNYEVGSSSQLLSFAKGLSSSTAEVADQVWKLSADDILDDNVELVDDADLLDADDLKKPDPSQLRDCGTGSGKRKACKNCTCGLAEELDAEAQNKSPKKVPTSACGSCYLGDAFRCASCPYLGMPAFKPGEKILLNDRQLKPDS